MGRKPCCEKVGLKRGPWAAEEDKKLVSFINTHGISCWRAIPKLAGLLRCGKSCRLRWTNYLRPDLKRGTFTEAEENLILELHANLGNRWSRIAVQLPGRTDNEIKNYWNTRLKKRLRSMGVDPVTHKPVESSDTETGDRKEDHSSKTLTNSESTPSAPSASQLSEEVAAQLKTFEGEPDGNVLMPDMTPKPEPICMDPKQSNSSSSDADVAPSPRHHLESSHIPGTFQDGPKLEGSFMVDSLHPHARHVKQEGSWLESGEGLAASGGVNFQELAASSLLRQTSGFTLSDMAVGLNWSFLGEAHRQSASTSTVSSWNDFHGRSSQEPELQKLAAILDQI